MKFKLSDKQGALEKLARHLGMFKNKFELTGRREGRSKWKSSLPVSAPQAELLALLSEQERNEVLRDLSDDEFAALEWDWRFWDRPDQIPPGGDWANWLILAGRGWGKTRTGAEWVRGQVEQGTARRITLIAETAADGRDVMVEGNWGILSVSPPWAKPTYEPSKRRLTWANGAVATLFNATEPDQLRGPQFDAA
ncbi:MAG TPA: terminase family protein [Devosia sp.]|nr:terminase family protein [Devosia sp.]